MSDTVEPLKGLGKNGANEFFETIIYMTAYDAIKSNVTEYTGRIENPILREATESAANVIAFGGIFMLIRYEEALLEKAFTVAGSMITGLMLLSKKSLGRLTSSAFRGRKLGILGKILGGIGDDGTQKALVISNSLGNFMQGRNNQYSSGSLMSSTFKANDNVTQKERSHLMLGTAMSETYVNSLMFKTMTSKFTDNDKKMIKKILGVDVGTEIKIDDLNKIGSFMFTQDDAGNMTGLTEQFFSLVSGLGYVVKKT